MPKNIIALTQGEMDRIFGIGKPRPGIKADGIQGPVTKKFQGLLQARLRSIFEKKKYDFDEKFNLIGVRMSDSYSNYFFDVGIITGMKSEDLICFPMSTMPGWGRVKSPPTVDGITGVAVLKEGQYKKLYRFINTWNGWTGAPFLFQVAPVEVYRDSNKDLFLNRNSVVTTDKGRLKAKGSYYQINYHTWLNWWSRQVSVLLYGQKYSNLSEGCQVLRYETFTKVLPRISAGAVIQNRIHYTLLHAKDFNIEKNYQG